MKMQRAAVLVVVGAMVGLGSILAACGARQDGGRDRAPPTPRGACCCEFDDVAVRKHEYEAPDTCTTTKGLGDGRGRCVDDTLCQASDRAVPVESP